MFRFKSGLRAVRPMILPSERYEEWFKSSMTIVPIIKGHCAKLDIQLPIQGPVSVQALFFRQRDYTGDLVGYEEALGDWLQEKRNGAGLIRDDRQIASWDGSRLFVDRDRPRIEIEIRQMEEPQMRLL